MAGTERGYFGTITLTLAMSLLLNYPGMLLDAELVACRTVRQDFLCDIHYSLLHERATSERANRTVCSA